MSATDQTPTAAERGSATDRDTPVVELRGVHVDNQSAPSLCNRTLDRRA